MSKVLILTAGFGEGHNAAARNLAAAIDDQAGAQASEIADLFAEASPRLNFLSRLAYLSMINRAPRLWSAFYGWVNRSEVFPRHLWFLRKEMRLLAARLQESSPSAVCSTFPVYGYMADRLRGSGILKAPFYNIVTDSISINTLWTRPRCTGWFVPNPETAEVLAKQGVPCSSIHDTGFPVQLFFAREGRKLAPPDLSSGARPGVLYILHSGVRHAESTARRLLAETDWELTFAVGRDEALRARLSAAAIGRRPPASILSWTNQIPRLLLTHHAVISKAGGATTQEAIAARCPMVVNQIVPGQEEGNYELLRRRSIGALAETPDEVLRVLRHAFSNNGWLWNRWREALDPLARVTAAGDIARQVLATGGESALRATPAANDERRHA
ncbi:MAG: galactosyldiacylglycerol synthase [Opitutaceae bacterium]